MAPHRCHDRIYDAHGFALALGLAEQEDRAPQLDALRRRHGDRDAVRALRDGLAADGVELVEECDEPDDVSVTCRDPDGSIVKAAWEPQR